MAVLGVMVVLELVVGMVEAEAELVDTKGMVAIPLLARGEILSLAVAAVAVAQVEIIEQVYRADLLQSVAAAVELEYTEKAVMELEAGLGNLVGLVLLHQVPLVVAAAVCSTVVAALGGCILTLIAAATRGRVRRGRRSPY